MKHLQGKINSKFRQPNEERAHSWCCTIFRLGTSHAMKLNYYATPLFSNISLTGWDLMALSAQIGYIMPSKSEADVN